MPSRHARVAGAAPGTDARGRARHARAARRARGPSSSSSRTCTARMPRPVPWCRSSPGSRPTSAWRSSRPRPAGRPFRTTTRGRTRAGRLGGAEVRLVRLMLPPLDRSELATLIEGIEGERASASVLLLVAERSGGSPLVAEELLAARRELPTVSLTGSLDEHRRRPDGDPIGGVPARAATPGAGRPADRPGPALVHRGRVRGRRRPAGAAIGQRPAAGPGRPSTPT